MFYIVETEEKVSELFSSIGDENIYLDIISFHDKYHPKLQSVCCFYLRPLSDHKGYIIPIKHSEALSITLKIVLDHINKLDSKKIFVQNLKYMKYFVKNIVAYDISYYAAMNGIELDVAYTASTIKQKFYRSHTKPDANFYLPITKLYEEKEEQYSVFEPIIQKMVKTLGSQAFAYFNDVSLAASELFYRIESNGIKVNKSPFIEHFSGIQHPAYNMAKGKIYTSYNLYNYTGRPSNSFNGINFLALNKENGERAIIIPSNDVLMDLDFSSYHIYLISKLIGYDFGGEKDLHTHFGKMYFKKDELTKEEYEKSKQITFSNIYGGVKPEYLQVPFFVMLNDKIQKIFSDLQQKNEYLFEITGRIYKLDHLNSMTATKFFNYLLQGLESYINLTIISKFLDMLEGKKTKIILYQYDSFLFDLKEDEKEGIIESINGFLGDKLAFKIKYGKNYNELE